MIKDIDTNFVYISDKLETRYSDFFKRFTQLLNEMDIKWDIIPNTNDIWVRDFMPIQIERDLFLQYKYTPDYLQSQEYIHLQSDPSLISNTMNLNCIKTNIIIDGGNITLCNKHIVMTDKIFTENNKEKGDKKFKKDLEDILGHEIIIIPWHCNNPKDEASDLFGHSDGIIHWSENNKILMSNHKDTDPDEAYEIRKILESHGYDITEMVYNVDTLKTDWNWAYINYLQVGQKIIIPAFGISEDKQALEYIQKANPNCQVRQIRMRDITARGSALHCITWNIKK